MKSSFHSYDFTSILACCRLDSGGLFGHTVGTPKVFLVEKIDMILSDDEIKERIESPLNLLNRLRTTLNRSIGPIIPAQPSSLPPTSSDIIPDLEDKIKNSTARSKANNIMLAAMSELEKRMPEIQKPEKLAQIATEMSRVIASHDDSRRNHGTINSQIIVYAPQVQSIENFEILDVVE